MQLPKNKINWSICLTCDGQGKILRQPSKRRRRRYQRELRESENNGHKKIPKKPVKSNKDLCLICNGSGLSISDGVTEIDFNYPHVAIIGGGIGGTALAVACLHRGIPFTLYERDTSFDSRSQGYGLTLQQASKAIAGLGIISLCGAITSTRHVVFNQEGTIIGEWGIRKWLQTAIGKNSKRKNIHIARQTLRSTLLEQLHETESVKWDHAFVNFSENKEGSIDVNFKVNGKNTIEKADLVVGADGIRSTTRSQLINENQTPLRYLGCIVILGICSLESLSDNKSSLLDSATVFQTVNGHERIYIMPYDNNSIMWQFSFPISEKKAKELHVNGPQSMKKEVTTIVQHWHDPISLIIKNTPESRITGYPIYDRPLISTDILQNFNNVTLIGDAAHPMSPFKGQGANQAILDALSLARMISIECRSHSLWREKGIRGTLLNKFEKEMLDRTSSKVLDSANAVGFLHSMNVLHKRDSPRGQDFKNN